MIALSFDTDHMSEERMVEFLTEIKIPGSSTFFCTQQYCCLDRKSIEIAPHPFLTGDRDWLEELKSKRSTFPSALGWRAHSCVFSHTLAEWISCNGYAYVSAHDAFGIAGLWPSRHLWGIWHVPIFYMDNLDFSRRRFAPERRERPFDSNLISTAISKDGLYVFDFHPIHLLLNTPDPDWYATTRVRFLAGDALKKLRYDDYGTRSFYEDLVAAMGKAGELSVSILEGLTAFVGEPIKSRPSSELPYDFDERRLRL
jgi:hypothetical protein